MTTSEKLFGAGELAPSNAAWGRMLGLTRQTIGERKKRPGLITLDELADIAYFREMDAQQIGEAVLGWRKERGRVRVTRKRA